MLKLNAGLSRKVGEPHYGSRGASVNVELELESGLGADPDGLLTRIRGLFELARRAVDQELAGPPGETAGHGAGPTGPANTNGHGAAPPRRAAARSGAGADPRPATMSQLRAIRALCGRQGLDGDRLARTRFQAGSLEALTLPEASSIIDELKAAAGNGGGR